MRYARRDNGERRFNVEEFLTAQQIQSYFSHTVAKLKHAVSGQIAWPPKNRKLHKYSFFVGHFNVKRKRKQTALTNITVRFRMVYLT